MKAKSLAKFLMQHPEAEIVTEMYVGDDFMVDINHVQLYTKNMNIEYTRNSLTDNVSRTGKCKVDVIYIGRESREFM